MFMATVWLALVIPLHEQPWVAHATTGVLLGLMVAFFRSYGGAEIRVEDGWFRAGRARIEIRHVGAVDALDAEGTRRVSGPEADARAFLVLRPYVKPSVRVAISDPVDPAPYWLVSSRHPKALAAALTAARDLQR